MSDPRKPGEPSTRRPAPEPETPPPAPAPADKPTKTVKEQ